MTIQRLMMVAFGLVISISGLPTALAKDLPDFTKLVEKYAPAVVNISTVGEVARPGRQNPRNGELEEFFRFFGPPGGRQEAPNRRPAQSLGSGFIVSKDGYIVTNNHVVDGAREIIVRLSDRRELIAELVGADARSDLAVLKVSSDEALPVIKLGESERLKVGEWVLAIGSPFGFDYSVTAGIVSAKGRSLPTAQNENYVPYIQTDVAINPGNSGGPLFNLEGEVIGINSQIYSNSGGFMGVSFAIPIDVAMEVVDQLKDSGRVSRGWLGVMIQEVTRELAESFGLDRPYGALISKVFEDTPAAVGGLRAGDVITKFDGRLIERSSELPHYVGRVKAGEKASVELMRDGEMIKMDINVGELADLDANGSRPQIGASGGDRLGLLVASLTAEELERLDIAHGVRVVEADGAAGDAEVRKGDIITRLNHKTVDSPQALKEIVDGLPAGRTVPVLVLRNTSPVFLALRVPQ
jgi:serine protease Do